MRIAAIQLQVDDSMNRQERLLLVQSRLARLADEGGMPDLILLPELWGCGFYRFDNYIRAAEPLYGPTLSFLSHWTKLLGCDILGGSIIEADNSSYYNTALYVNRQGRLVGTYRKIHLFGYQSAEKKILTAGHTPQVLKTSFGKIGLATCYDLRFPEQFRLLTDWGAEILLILSAWPEKRLDHWRLLNQVRALENQCWLVSCNCSGTQNSNRYAGHSMAVTPWGEILAEAGADPYIMRCEIDPSQTTLYRKSFPALADRIRFSSEDGFTGNGKENR